MAEICRSCSAEVEFHKHAVSGRTMIFDVKRYTAWQVNDDGRAVPVKVLKDHHAACPAASAWKDHDRGNPPDA